MGSGNAVHMVPQPGRLVRDPVSTPQLAKVNHLHPHASRRNGATGARATSGSAVNGLVRADSQAAFRKAARAPAAAGAVDVAA